MSGNRGVKGAVFNSVQSGELQGSTSALQCPSIPCYQLMFKAHRDNAGFVYIGGEGVTSIDGSTDATSGWQLDAGETTPWLPVSNLDLIYRISDNDGDDLTYILLG